jgi:hypothetical protein
MKNKKNHSPSPHDVSLSSPSIFGKHRLNFCCMTKWLIDYLRFYVFIVPHLLWHGTSVFPVSSEGLPQSVASYIVRHAWECGGPTGSSWGDTMTVYSKQSFFMCSQTIITYRTYFEDFSLTSWLWYKLYRSESYLELNSGRSDEKCRIK